MDIAIGQLLGKVLEEKSCALEVKQAKAYFELRAGRANAEDRTYEAYMNAFLHWYVFDRGLETGKRPIEVFFQENPEQQEGFFHGEELQHRHSVFLCAKHVQGKKLVIRDLLTKKSYGLEPEEVYFGVETGEVFNAHLFILGEKAQLGNYFLVHPYAVRKAIIKAAHKHKKTGKSEEDFLFDLLHMRCKWEQYKQMSMEKIYAL